MTKQRIKHTQSIDIKRNPVERILMTVKDLIAANRKKVLLGFAGLMVAAVALIVISFFVSNYSITQTEKYETVMEKYAKIDSSDVDSLKKSADELIDLADNTAFGFASEMPYYVAGNIYFNIGKFSEAEDLLMKYVKSSSSDIFVPLAILKAAIAAEEQGQIDRALDYCKKLEKQYSDAPIQDQVLYSSGRLYSLKGDSKMAKKYYDDLIQLYPRSRMAERAKKRAFFITDVDSNK